MRIQRHEGTFTLSVASESGELEPSGCAFRLEMTDPIYVGLGVCAHDNSVLEKAIFSKVSLISTETPIQSKPSLQSVLEIVPIGSKDRRVLYHTRDLIEAPNWSRDAKYLLFNSKGHIWKLPMGGGTPERVDTGFANRCNNDHGFSPDGTQLVISDQSQTRKSLIYILPVAGGTPRQVTELGPSYWHGWSPDGKTLAYCAERDGNFDIYTIPVSGGHETRLTTSASLDDGPDYSPDGRFVYFNSDRTGSMQIWRMQADGSQQEPVTADEYNNWFPHPSPDGKWILCLSYAKGVQDHPANKDVWLRLIPAAGGPIQTLARLYGGQGTINVPSWSPDSREVAFVSYHWSW
jgi:Tol biopolymer transport system component